MLKGTGALAASVVDLLEAQHKMINRRSAHNYKFEERGQALRGRYKSSETDAS